MQARQIKILDTTLRDGQQCPGAGMSFEKNIEYAHLAAQLGIDVLEAGFPSASQSEFEMVNAICKELLTYDKGPIIASLCQLREAQIDITIQALLPANSYKRARLHTYLPVDPNLMEASLGSYANNKTQIIDDVYCLIKKAADLGMEVEFSPEGYSRMGDNFEFTSDVIRAAVSAGVLVINCPDTIGGACDLQGENYFVENMKKHAAMVEKEFPEKKIIWSVHCHNDFGLALVNTMNAVFHGPATQIEGCINGLGERAGNAALEQCIMYIKSFGKSHSVFTNINTPLLKKVSDFVSDNMLTRQAHWPITGINAAKHTSGGHTNAILHNPLAYQPFDPKEVGNEISFLFGPSSGGNHAKAIIENFGYLCENHEKAEIAQYVKEIYSERRKGITDNELLEAYMQFRKPIQVENFTYGRTQQGSDLTLVGKFFDKKGEIKFIFKGGDSALAALHQAIDAKYPGIKIEHYNSEAIDKGINAKSKSVIHILDAQQRSFTGIGEDQDIEISALKALIDAVNQSYLEHFFKVRNP